MAQLFLIPSESVGFSRQSQSSMLPWILGRAVPRVAFNFLGCGDDLTSFQLSYHAGVINKAAWILMLDMAICVWNTEKDLLWTIGVGSESLRIVAAQALYKALEGSPYFRRDFDIFARLDLNVNVLRPGRLDQPSPVLGVHRPTCHFFPHCARMARLAKHSPLRSRRRALLHYLQ
jgi:hypothetical protein